MTQQTVRLCVALLLGWLASTSGCALFRSDDQPLPDWLHVAQALDGSHLPLQRVSWAGFRNPEAASAKGLYLLEPYQPGKIPLVLIHGLASDPLTWNTVIERFHSDPEIVDRYQLWVFRYPTGNSYLKAAADLRRELYAARETYDPCETDFAFDQLILIGHSMGGLVAKLQVTESVDTLWKTVSDEPLDSFPMSDEMRADVEPAVMFKPVPFVRQVIFIATPHRGSDWTDRSIGKLGRRLIEFPQFMQDEYAALIQQNADFLKINSPTLPTSLDHLHPDSPILQATLQLPISPDVESHSIIGTGHRLPDRSLGDGVVSLASAQLAGVSSEHVIDATHLSIHHSEATIDELRRILLRP